MKISPHIRDLLKRCAEYLYYVYEVGDPESFDLEAYLELSQECILLSQLPDLDQLIQDALVQETLSDEAEQYDS